MKRLSLWAALIFAGAMSVTGVSASAADIVLVNATAHLTLVAPTKNTDGTPLTDLAGYRVFQNGTPVATLAAAALGYDRPNLPPGRYTFAVTAFNAKKFESAKATADPAQVFAPVTVTKTPASPESITVVVTVP